MLSEPFKIKDVLTGKTLRIKRKASTFERKAKDLNLATKVAF